VWVPPEVGGENTDQTDLRMLGTKEQLADLIRLGMERGALVAGAIPGLSQGAGHGEHVVCPVPEW